MYGARGVSADMEFKVQVDRTDWLLRVFFWLPIPDLPISHRDYSVRRVLLLLVLRIPTTFLLGVRVLGLCGAWGRNRGSSHDPELTRLWHLWHLPASPLVPGLSLIEVRRPGGRMNYMRRIVL